MPKVTVLVEKLDEDEWEASVLGVSPEIVMGEGATRREALDDLKAELTEYLKEREATLDDLYV
jgi:predicted RNase H-like HicB family nuclease